MYVSRRIMTTLMSVVLTGFLAASALAGDSEAQKSCDSKGDGPACAQRGGRCHDCGCLSGCCNKVCRLTCKPKKVKVTCFKSECDVVCLPPPSHRGCRHCQMVDCDGDKDGDGKCDGKGCDAGCANPKKVVWFDWDVPGKGKGGDCCQDGHSGNAKKLLKKEVEVELKGVYEYTWEVVDLCKGCEQKSIDKAPEVGPAAEVPPPPPVAATTIYGKPVVERMAARNE